MHTTSSNSPNKLPASHKPLDILQIKVNKTCPALILARSRKHSVIGRTKILISSTNLRKGIKYQGEFVGKMEQAVLYLSINNITLLSQLDIAKNKLNPKIVVIGNL
jgi:hypothetical protein